MPISPNIFHCSAQKMDPFYSNSNGSECGMNVEQSSTSDIVTDLAVHWAQVKLLLKAMYSSLPHICLGSLLFGIYAPSHYYKTVPQRIANSVFSLHHYIRCIFHIKVFLWTGQS